MNEKNIVESPLDQSDVSNIFEQEYIPYILKWGRVVTLLAMLGVFVPAIMMVLFGGAALELDKFLLMITTIVGMVGAGFMDPIYTYPMLGASGTLVGYVTGDIYNLKIPCSVAAQECINAEPGSERASLAATIGLTVSFFVKFAFISVSVLLLNLVLSVISPAVMATLNLMVPGLLGGVYAKFCLAKPKLLVPVLGVGGAVFFLSSVGIIPGGFRTIISVAVTIAVSWLLFKKKIIE